MRMVNRMLPTVIPVTLIRRMSSKPMKHLFAIYAPDYMDPDILERRLSVRERHLKGVGKMLDNGIMSAYMLLRYIRVSS
jgi:hypothetical protein